MEIPKALYDYALSLPTDPTSKTRISNDMFNLIVAPIVKRITVTRADYDVICYMDNYLNALYDTLPTSSTGYINELKNRYSKCMMVLNCGLNSYVQYGHSMGEPLVRIRAAISKNIFTNEVLYKDYKSMINNNGFGGDNPLPNMESLRREGEH